MLTLLRFLIFMLTLLRSTCTADDLDKELEEFQDQPDPVGITVISKHEGDCRHHVENGDRVYLYFSGIEHDTGELFSTNRGLGDSLFIVRLGEPNVLSGTCIFVCLYLLSFVLIFSHCCFFFSSFSKTNHHLIIPFCPLYCINCIRTSHPHHPHHPYPPPFHPHPPPPPTGFQEGLINACEGDKRLIQIPASRNNHTSASRVENIPNGVALDFDVEILLVVPKAALKITDRLLLKMRKTSDVNGNDVQEAMDLGMPVDVVDTNGRSLLVTGSFTKNIDAVKILLKHGADTNLAMHTGMTAAIYAAGEGHVDILRLLLQHGAKTDAHLHLQGSPLQGYTALHFACLQGRTDSVKLLLEHGADPGAKEQKGLTPLAVARSILLDGANHKGLKPRDRERGKEEFSNIKKLMLNALVEKQQREMKGDL